MFPTPISFAVLVATIYLFLAMSDSKPEDILITMGNKQVPLSKINKPHNVVVGGVDKPLPDLKQFPDIEPEAKAREAKLEEERKAKAEK